MPPRKPLDAEIRAAQRLREQATAQLAAATDRIAAVDRRLAILLEAQVKLGEAAANEHSLHESHSVGTISDVQDQTEHSLGVRIAAGRSGQSASRKAQIAAGMTDEQVAALVGKSRSTVCKWHSGSIRIPDDARKLLAKRGIPAASWSK